MQIQQLTIFVENKPGRLSEVVNCISNTGVNMHALSLADTTDFGIVRLIVDNVENARDALREQGFIVKTTEVIAVALEHRPGSLAEVLRELAGAGISIEYMYAFPSRSVEYQAMVVMRLANQDRSVGLLPELNIHLLSHKDIN